MMLQAKSFDPVILLIYGGLFAVIYFFFIRPQSKRAKEQKKFSEELKKGDRVVTTGGIHGRILELEETTVMIEIDRNVKIRMERSGISMEMSREIQNKEQKATSSN